MNDDLSSSSDGIEIEEPSLFELISNRIKFVKAMEKKIATTEDQSSARSLRIEKRHCLKALRKLEEDLKRNQKEVEKICESNLNDATVCFMHIEKAINSFAGNK